MKALKLLFIFWVFIFFACDRYNPVNDKIYAIPEDANLYSSVSLSALEDAIKENPNVGENYYKKALFHLTKQDDSLALESISTALKLDSTQQKYYFTLSKVYANLQENDRAIEAISKAQNPERENLELLILAGELYFRKKDYDNAVKYLNRALNISRLDPRIYYLKGNVAMARRDSATALQNLKFAIRIKPDYIAVYNSFAELYSNYELYQRAIKYANMGLKYNPHHDLLNFNKAQAYKARLYFDDSAKICYAKAYLANPSLYRASYELGKYAFDASQYQTAQKYFESSLEYNPDYSRSNYYLGLCYRYAGKKQEALLKFEKTMELDPQNLVAKDMYWAVRNEIIQEKLIAREDSIRRAYYQMLEEQRKKQLELQKQGNNQ